MYIPPHHTFERLVFPVLDRVNGTHIARTLQFLNKSETWSLAQLRELQVRKLQELMAYARTQVAPYAEFWKQAADRGGPDSEFPQLRGLPLITKEHLRGLQQRFPVPGWQGRLVRSRTSGSTGQPMAFVRSAEQESWFWALRFRMWQWAGYRIGDPYLTINLNPRLAWKKRLQDRLFRCSYLTYNADNLDSKRIVECLDRKGIAHLNGFSSSLYTLARYMERHKIRNPGVRSVTVTGDMLFPHYRELIERQFDLKVVDYYGAGGEGMHLASQCELSGGYHLHTENSIVELVAGDRLARPGELGRIVVTQLDNFAMPLIRYDLGDTAIADTKSCGCGRAHPLLQSIQGRIYDIVYAPNGSALLPHFFVVVFKNLQQVRQYQAIQNEPGCILVKLVAAPQCDRAACERDIVLAVAQATGGSLGVTFEWVNDIPLSGAGKRRVVVSNLGSSAARPYADAANPSGHVSRPMTDVDDAETGAGRSSGPRPFTGSDLR